MERYGVEGIERKGGYEERKRGMEGVMGMDRGMKGRGVEEGWRDEQRRQS